MASGSSRPKSRTVPRLKAKQNARVRRRPEKRRRSGSGRVAERLGDPDQGRGRGKRPEGDRQREPGAERRSATAARCSGPRPGQSPLKPLHGAAGHVEGLPADAAARCSTAINLTIDDESRRYPTTGRIPINRVREPGAEHESNGHHRSLESERRGGQDGAPVTTWPARFHSSVFFGSCWWTPTRRPA